MKALAVWPRRGKTGVVDHEEPRLSGQHSVRFRTLEVGVCGTDAEICSLESVELPKGSEYLIVGHEAIGQVEAVGDRVSRFRPGDLVVPSVRRPCLEPGCPGCRAGEQDFCVTGRYTERGIRGANGFLAEVIVEHDQYLFPVPPELRGVGVLTEPLTIAEKAVRQYIAVQRRLPWVGGQSDHALLEGKRVVVLGAGPVGILGCMLLLHRGCQVWVYSRGPGTDLHGRLVQSAGARYVSSDAVSFAELSEEIGAAELVYEATGAPSLVFTVMQHLAPNAVLLLAGVPASDVGMETRPGAIMRQLVLGNQVVLGTVNANAADFTAAIDDLGGFLRAWPSAVPQIITGRHALADFCTCALKRKRIKEVVIVQE